MTQRLQPSRRPTVAVVMGGTSSEHDVSLASGLQVLAGLPPERYRTLPVIVGRDGGWHAGRTPERVLLARSPGEAAEPAAEVLRATRHHGFESALVHGGEGRLVDVAFLVLHGPDGEDGRVQGLLDLLGVPFTGSGVLASALAMDKVMAKGVYRSRGMAVARDAVVSASDHAGDAIGGVARVAREVGLPCVVKPVAGGSSFGTHVVEEEAGLARALEDALRLDSRALVEELVVGRELTCGVLGGGPAEPAEVLPVTEIVPRDAGFFDFRAKYTQGACEEVTPARIDGAQTSRVQELALTAHEALGCEGMSRTDFILRDGVPVTLETNTIPGMTETSLLPQAAAAAGISFPQLLDRLVTSALRRAGRE